MDDNESPFQPFATGGNQNVDLPSDTGQDPPPVEESLDDMATALRVQLRGDQRRRLTRK